MEEQKDCLPIYGVGPYYGAFVIISALIGMALAFFGFLEGGALSDGLLKKIFLTIGFLLILFGIAIWAPAALGKGCIDKYIKTNTLCTEGVYRFVRNPCYSGIMIAFTGGLFLMQNLYLLILPFCYWIGMTVLMKHSEEKWLLKLYGKSYEDYCRRVNRCIPWFPKK